MIVSNLTDGNNPLFSEAVNTYILHHFPLV
jgi:hypothetical protein